MGTTYGDMERSAHTPTASDVPPNAAAPGAIPVAPDGADALSHAQAGALRRGTPRISDQELATITFRAAGIGVPAWRVAAALGMPPAPETALDEQAAAERRAAADRGVI